MFIRFSSWVAIGIAAAFLVVAQATYALSTIIWLAFGVGVGALFVSLAVAYLYRRHLPTLLIGMVTAVVSGWTVVASLVFSQATVQNLALAGGLAMAGLALVGLTAHELSSERVVHSIEVSENQTRRDSPLAPAA